MWGKLSTLVPSYGLVNGNRQSIDCIDTSSNVVEQLRHNWNDFGLMDGILYGTSS